MVRLHLAFVEMILTYSTTMYEGGNNLNWPKSSRQNRNTRRNNTSKYFLAGNFLANYFRLLSIDIFMYIGIRKNLVKFATSALPLPRNEILTGTHRFEVRSSLVNLDLLFCF